MRLFLCSSGENPDSYRDRCYSCVRHELQQYYRGARYPTQKLSGFFPCTYWPITHIIYIWFNLARSASHKIRNRRHLIFLLDVLALAFGAFGGPQIHFTMIHRRLVLKRNYITEEELKELNSLCNMLPGPTSTQTITAIGFKIGGPKLAFLTLAVWISPACILMTAFALLISGLEGTINLSFLKYLQPMASGFIIFAAYRFTQLFIHKPYHWFLLISSAFLGISIDTPFLFPLLISWHIHVSYYEIFSFFIY